MFSLLIAIVVTVMSVGGMLVPMLTNARYGNVELMTVLMATVCGYAAIVASFVLGMPAVLLALRSAATEQGHMGRGRGLVSIILSVTVPVLSLAILSAFVARKIQSVDWNEVVPHVLTDDSGRMRIMGGELLGSEIGTIIDQVNEMVDEGYSVGFDENGNLMATDPSGQTVTITPEDLETLGALAEAEGISQGNIPQLTSD